MANGRARAEVVGSLLQPNELLEARTTVAEGKVTAAQLRAIEDDAVLASIALQEQVGLDVITDGEMRRPGWADTNRHLNGLELRKGPRSYPQSARNSVSETGMQTVVAPISPKSDDPVGWEYPFLHEHATSRTKYTMAAPSYHRRYWVDGVSEAAYANCEEYLLVVRDWLAGVAQRLADEGCDYIQLDAPNYGSLCDPITREFHTAQGHDLDEQIAFDAALDSSLFEGLSGVTRALHVCRGNTPGGNWHSSGGYAAIADQMFPNLDLDVVLLEYDSERAGDLGPIAKVKPGTTVVLGLLTTKDGTLEDEGQLEGRISEAEKLRDLDDLALSTQCGFASAANAPMSADEQRAKLELVGHLARRIWD
jgi:5-methyltetrahydropteroyltriglutamate--homocysteine methyltransferase